MHGLTPPLLHGALGNRVSRTLSCTHRVGGHTQLKGTLQTYLRIRGSAVSLCASGIGT